MAIDGWKQDESLGKEDCDTDRKSWKCPNMLEVEGDLSMTHEHYECKQCGRTVTCAYDDMR